MTENKIKCPKCNGIDIVRMRWDEANKIMYIVCCNPKCKAKGIQSLKLED